MANSMVAHRCGGGGQRDGLWDLSTGDEGAMQSAVRSFRGWGRVGHVAQSLGQWRGDARHNLWEGGRAERPTQVSC